MDQPFLTRRSFLHATGLIAAGTALGACGGSDNSAGGPSGNAAEPAPSGTFQSPSTSLSGSLKILMWSHFVPRHDKWFDPFAKDWGRKVGVNVSVDHINTADVPTRLAAEIAAGEGHDLVQHIAPLAQFEPSVLDLKDVADEASKRWGDPLEICRKSSLNPATNKYFAYAPGWVPDPGDYRKSLWEKAGMPDGPSTWDELLTGGAKIKKDQGVQMGIGMSQEIDSNMATRAIMWSFGASVQDQNSKVVLNSPETVAAVEYMTKLFKQTMTNEVFSWTAASNNQGLIAGKLSYILNSISAWRTAQGVSPAVANDVYFLPALKGPKTALVSGHVMYNWVVPKYAKNADAAKEFLLHYTANFPQATYYSELYDFPAYEKLVPQRDKWLADDPFGAKPKDKLAFLKDAKNWTTNLGHPGSANTAVGEVLATFLIPNMFAQAARGANPQQVVQQTDAQVRKVFDKWRAKGLVGG